MGIVFGKTGISVENGLSPPFEVLAQRAGYQVRWYGSYIQAEVAQLSAEDKEEGKSSFGLLAKYIGVFGDPANYLEGRSEGQGKSEAISMTGPVVMKASEPKAAEPAPKPSDTGLRAMSFILPQKYKSLRDVPKPKDERVSVKEVPAKGVLVREYSGRMSTQNEEQNLSALLDDVASDGVFADKLPPKEAGLEYNYAGYHPPFTIPFLRKNEVWVKLPLRKDEIVRLIEQRKATEGEDKKETT